MNERKIIFYHTNLRARSHRIFEFLVALNHRFVYARPCPNMRRLRIFRIGELEIQEPKKLLFTQGLRK